MQTCDNQKFPRWEPTTEIKKQITEKKQDKEIAQARVDTVEKIREKVVLKWRTIRHDSLIPCHEKLIICDTLLVADSTLISELKTEIKIDNEIIGLQDKHIRADSLTISVLTKSVKKERRKKKFWRTVCMITTGLAGALIMK